MNFLDNVLEAKRSEIARLRQTPPRFARVPDRDFARALRGPGLSVIAEIKRRSPSKGELQPQLDVAETARAYSLGGAAAISCLTDARFFGARDDDFAQARTAGLPVLRKDFLIDEIQIDESASLGAAAVLLIVKILEGRRLETLLRHAASLGLEALVEVHDEAELDRALSAGASIVGVNNRDLGTLEVDPERALRLRPRIPAGTLSVAESGVRSRGDIDSLAAAGFDAVLIGEALVASSDPVAALMNLTGKGVEVSR
ncbi:MAG: indole-3-glycerol phosphate synthase TrpC [Vicinamibacteria bacterium]|nr:indole-3-glycerol phosphate synthase TrpC [Vicinamibacteria bacterium]